MGLTEAQVTRLGIWKERENGLPIRIENGTSHADIQLTGGHIEELVLSGERVLGSYLRLPTTFHSKPGATFLCTPFLGTDHRMGISKPLPKHGLGRGRRWVSDLRYPDSVNIHTRLSDPSIQPLEVSQSHHISPYSYSLIFTHRNVGSQIEKISPGVHFYFDAPQGWKSGTIGRLHEGYSTVVRLVDLATHRNGLPQVIYLGDSNILMLPGKQSVLLEQEGLPYAYVWVDGTAGNYDNHYICIEPIATNPNDPSYIGIKSGETHQARIVLSR